MCNMSNTNEILEVVSQVLIRCVVMGVVVLLLWWAGLAVPDSHEEVKVVWHQAVGIGIDDRLDVLGVQFEKVGIVPLLAEQGLAAVPAIVDVIVLAEQ